MHNQNLSQKEIEALRIIRNKVLHTGFAPSVRYLMEELGYRSPRSASIIIESLIEKGYLNKKEDGTFQLINDFISNDRATTISIPLIGQVACGSPILAEENIEAYIPVSTKLAKPSHNYFLLNAVGDSMNDKGINNGDLVLIKQQNTANNGDSVLALIDEEATIKEFRQAGNTVILMPRSKNPVHKPIILTDDFRVQGVVVTTVPVNERGEKNG